jgi:hypothetical protein
MKIITSGVLRHSAVEYSSSVYPGVQLYPGALGTKGDESWSTTLTSSSFTEPQRNFDDSEHGVLIILPEYSEYTPYNVLRVLRTPE